MRKLLVGVALLVPLAPAAAALAATQVDPTAGHTNDRVLDGELAKIGFGTNADGVYWAYAQLGNEDGSAWTDIGRIGGAYGPDGVQLYGDDYTAGNVEPMLVTLPVPAAPELPVAPAALPPQAVPEAVVIPGVLTVPIPDTAPVDPVVESATATVAAEIGKLLDN